MIESPTSAGDGKVRRRDQVVPLTGRPTRRCGRWRFHSDPHRARTRQESAGIIRGRASRPSRAAPGRRRGGRPRGDDPRLRSSKPPGPVYYFPRSDVRMDARRQPHARSASGRERVLRDLRPRRPAHRHGRWTYLEPSAGYGEIAGQCLLCGRIDEAWVGDEQATSQPGRFYGGWVRPGSSGRSKASPVIGLVGRGDHWWPPPVRDGPGRTQSAGTDTSRVDHSPGGARRHPK